MANSNQKTKFYMVLPTHEVKYAFSFTNFNQTTNANVLAFSFCKSHNTFKLLVAISPRGVITFVLGLCGGRISGKAITQSSGLLELLEAGDNIMADRRFDLEDVFMPKISPSTFYLSWKQETTVESH